MLTTTREPASISELIAGVIAGDLSCEEGLLRFLMPGTRLLLQRRVDPDEVPDAVQEVLLSTLEAIRSRRLREPMALPGYVRTIATRVAAQIRKQYPGRRRHQDVSYAVISHGVIAESPEDCFLRREQRHLAEKLLSRLNTKERELLLRFYFLEQDKEQICRDLSMTENQFRLAKSRAKGKLIARAVGLIGVTSEQRGSTHSGEVKVA